MIPELNFHLYLKRKFFFLIHIYQKLFEGTQNHIYHHKIQAQEQF